MPFVSTLFTGAAMILSLVGPVPPSQPPDPCATATTECSGTLPVPLDWSHPDGEQITVAFTWIPRKNQSSPATGTIMSHLGGPMATLTDRAKKAVTDGLGPVLDHQNLLISDIRGFGKSSPISCSGVDVTKPETIVGCAQQLGPRGAFFNTGQAAQDYDAIRSSLGIDKVTFFGNSYGTRLADAYVSRFPQHVSAVYVNGTVPTMANGYSGALGPYPSIQGDQLNLQRICQASAACRALPGTTAQRLTAVIPQVPTGDRAKLATMLEDAPFDPYLNRTFNAAVDSYLRHDPVPLKQLLAATTIPTPPTTLPTDNFAATFLAYGCADINLPYDRAAAPAVRKQQLAAFYTRQRPFRPFTPEEGSTGSVLVSAAKLCTDWPLLRNDPPSLPGAKYPSVPMLQTAGGTDMLSDLDPGATAHRYPQGKFVLIPNGIHQSWDTDHASDGWCARTMMRDFLNNPRTPARDYHCDWTTFKPLGRLPVTAAKLPPAHAADLSPQQRTTLAAVFATAVDATMELHPINGRDSGVDYTQAGLRGGSVSYNAKTRTATLTAARFVNDAAVDGTIVVDAQHRATASLTVGGQQVAVSWALYSRTSDQSVTGTFDGRTFQAVLPGF
jgi:pimeloyl-ACP methyl ester carboxylesterase